MQLTAEAVEKLFHECVSSEGEPTEGVVIRIKLDTRGREAEIGLLLMELPEEFRADKGGGWSFLNACQDRHGNQWTGLHATMEKLLMLGLASKQATILMPREMWDVLPGGMPYFAVTPRAVEATAS